MNFNNTNLKHNLTSPFHIQKRPLNHTLLNSKNISNNINNTNISKYNNLTKPKCNINFKIKSNNNKQLLKIGSLNIAGLKTQSATTSKKISYIHSLNVDVLCIQETHSTPILTSILSNKVKPYFSQWSKYCCIIIKNKDLKPTHC